MDWKAAAHNTFRPHKQATATSEPGTSRPYYMVVIRDASNACAHLADCAAIRDGSNVEILGPLLLNVGGGESTRAQSLLCLINWPAPRDAQNESCLHGNATNQSTTTIR